MRHHGSEREAGRRRVGRAQFDGLGPEHHRGGPGLQHFSRHGSGFSRPSTWDRIECLEDVQRDLEEMTADVADQLAGLKRREAVRAEM